ncbi:MAG: hypothetical protein GF335_04725 [Candidatus Moranbacteria bacterium]|nr:hypothetical protein [Candidatus Moranbacteria bacterium]
MKNFSIFSLIFCLFFSINGCVENYDKNFNLKDPVYKNTGLTHKDRKLQQLIIKDQIFKVELATDPIKRQRGLMFRKNLPSNQGMLFVFNKQDKHPFWMRNTLIPLDIIWISSNKKVVDFQRATPCKTKNCPYYISGQKALYVLELNAGDFKGAIGDKVDFKLN